MRSCPSWSALALLVAGCSSPATPAPSTTGVPSFTENAASPAATAPRTSAASTTDPAGTAPAASGSRAAPPGSAPPGGTPPGGTPPGGESEGSGSNAPGQVPLAPDSDPEMAGGGAAEPPQEGSSEPGQMPPAADPPPAPSLDNVLLFTRTTGFRHDSIEPGVEAVRRLGQSNGFGVERTEDPAFFSDENLARFDVVVWLNTDSEVLNDPARRAFERYIRAGGGWVGVHAASASEYGWAWYGQLLGGNAFFRGHPAIQPARVQVAIADHPSTQHLPQSFTLTDEWYSFRANPRSSVQVLMTLDESSYGVGDLSMGDHPIAWYHEFDGGRAWYTALGHPNELYSDPLFALHLLGGMRWAAGAAP